MLFFLLMNYKTLRAHWLKINFYEVMLHQLTNNYFELLEILWFYIKWIENCLSVQLSHIDMKWTFHWFYSNLFHFKYHLLVMHRRRNNSTLSSALMVEFDTMSLYNHRALTVPIMDTLLEFKYCVSFSSDFLSFVMSRKICVHLLCCATSFYNAMSLILVLW